MSNFLVMLDPGHGGHDSGAVGPSGVLEKAINLQVCRAIRDAHKLDETMLRAFEIRLTRDKDVYLTLKERAQIANQASASFFLSIHCNAGGGHGFEAYTSPGETMADRCATLLLKQYKKKFTSRPMRSELGDGDVDKEARFTVLTRTYMPAVLFELEFIDSYAGETFLEQNVNQIARTMLLGIHDAVKFISGESDNPQTESNLISVHVRLAKLEREMRDLAQRIFTLEHNQ